MILYCISCCLQICQKAFEFLYDVSHETKLKLVREVQNGVVGENKRMKKIIESPNKADQVQGWLTVYFEENCDIMPMCDNQHGKTDRHLPFFFTKTMVYKKFLSEGETQDPILVPDYQ